MIEEISTILYDEEEGLMLKIRNGEEITEEVKDKIRQFSKEVNKHLKENKVETREVAICTDMIFTFMLYPEMKNFGVEIYQNINEGIDY